MRFVRDHQLFGRYHNFSAAINAVAPFLRNNSIAVVCAGDLSEDGAGIIVIFAELDGGEGALRKSAVVVPSECGANLKDLL